MFRKLFAGILAMALAGPIMAAEEGDVGSLNLRNVDIRALIDTIAEITGKNFLVDPRVKGEVTLISSKSMAPAEVYQVFLSTLEVHGFVAVPAGNVIKIIPDLAVRLGSTEGDRPLPEVPGEEIVTRVIEVKHVDPVKLVPILRPLIPQPAHLAASAESMTLLISDRAANVSRIVELVRRIDRTTEEGVEVVRLKHAEADQLIKTINEFYGVVRGEPTARVVLAADPRSNSILLSADPERRLRIRTLIAHLDTPLDGGGKTQIVFLRNTDAEELAGLLQRLVGQESGTDPQATEAEKAERVNIQAHPSNNALLLTAPEQEMRNLKSIVRQLDIQRAQILVEAVIAEVSTDLSQELGAQFAIANLEGGTEPLGFTNFGSNRLSDLAASAGADGFPPFGPGAFLGVGRIGTGGTQWAVLVSALSGDAASNILSTPTLLATDNEEAEIVVGQNVPFITGQFTNTGTANTNAVNPFQTIERRDVGITLRVKPQINEGDRVRMEIEQEVSSLVPSSVSTSDVVTNKRSIKTTATIRDGQVIVLGGLIEDRFIDNAQKVPLLGDIPVLGGIFRFGSTQKVKQNLMVFIRPVIVSDPDLAESYAGRKYDYLRARRLESRITERGQLDLEGAAPQLPERIDDLFERGTDASPPPRAQDEQAKEAKEAEPAEDKTAGELLMGY